MSDKTRSLGHALLTILIIGSVQYLISMQIDGYFTPPPHANHMGSRLIVGAIIFAFLMASSIIFAPLTYHYLKNISKNSAISTRAIPSKVTLTILFVVLITTLLLLTESLLN